LLSSDDFGSSVERTAKLHPLWRAQLSKTVWVQAGTRQASMQLMAEGPNELHIQRGSAYRRLSRARNGRPGSHPRTRSTSTTSPAVFAMASRTWLQVGSTTPGAGRRATAASRSPRAGSRPTPGTSTSRPPRPAWPGRRPSARPRSSRDGADVFPRWRSQNVDKLSNHRARLAAGHLATPPDRPRARSSPLAAARNSLGMCCLPLGGRQEAGQWPVPALQRACSMWRWSRCEVERGAAICGWSGGLPAGRL
jgi:hypothetical protein